MKLNWSTIYRAFRQANQAQGWNRSESLRQTHFHVEELEQRILLHAAIGDALVDVNASGFDVLFAPDTSAEYVSAIESQLHVGTAADAGPEFAAFQFNDVDRWSTTTTSGGGLSQGDATTVTWSIVPDGTSIYGYAGERTSNSDLRSKLDGIYGSIGTWLPLFEQSFARLSELSGVNYIYEANDDGSAWTSTSIADGQENVRGDVRIAGHNIDRNSGILAYNFFPDFSDMVLDTGDMKGRNGFFLNTTNNSIRLRNTVMHEAGHGLGIDHVESSDASFLMEPYIDTSFEGPQFDDILAMHRGYGDVNELAGNDTIESATSLGLVIIGQTITIGAEANDAVVAASDIDLVSIDDDSDKDHYSFNVSSSSTVNLTLTPLGPTYNQGPQGGSQSPFNAQSQSDLTLAVLDYNGTVLSIANANGSGVGETLNDVLLPVAGQYYVRVTGAQNAAQMYQLDVTAAGPLSSIVDNDPRENRVDENAPNGTEVGITSFAEDSTYSLVDSDGARFAIDPTSGVVTVAGAIDRETDGASRDITVRATSTDGFQTRVFTIAIADVDEFDVGQITDIDDTTDAVNENAAIGTEVGITAFASDDDATDIVTYSLVGNSTEFAINGATGVVTVADGGLTAGDYSITVLASSSDGSESTQPFISITVNPVLQQGLFYFTVDDSTSLGSIAAENEDIIEYDRATGEFSTFFDGSKFSLAGNAIDAFAIHEGDHFIYMSFAEPGRIKGVAFDDSDVLFYVSPEAAVDSPFKTGFYFYFDGSDVGLTANSEDIDAISFDTSGYIIVSTTDAFSVNGGVSGSGEDLIRFEHTNLGGTTSGSWTPFFDGDDVGLGEENIDGISVAVDGTIYISTEGDFAVPGITGGGEDVFVFNPAAGSGGFTTSGSFEPQLFFDGSEEAIGNGLGAIWLPAATHNLASLTTSNADLVRRDAGDHSVKHYQGESSTFLLFTSRSDRDLTSRETVARSDRNSQSVLIEDAAQQGDSSDSKQSNSKQSNRTAQDNSISALSQLESEQEERVTGVSTNLLGAGFDKLKSLLRFVE